MGVWKSANDGGGMRVGGELFNRWNAGDDWFGRGEWWLDDFGMMI